MLKVYKHKRDFKITPEPSGKLRTNGRRKVSRKSKGLSFVIQKHAARRLHYDLRLEVDGVMVSWAVPKGPSLNPAEKRLAVMTEDHPIEYSDFEGVIPKHQYGAGQVIIWDHGTYSPDADENYSWDDQTAANNRMRQGLKEGKLSFYLKGDKLKGAWTLIKLRKTDKDWLLIKQHDQFEDSKKDVTKLDESVVSGRSIEDLQEHGADNAWTAHGAKPVKRAARGRNKKGSGRGTGNGKREGKGKRESTGKRESKGSPADSDGHRSKLLQSGKKAAFSKDISPMLATLVDAPFSAPGWFFEPKLDGVRVIAYIKNGKCKLRSRRGLDLTDKYPAVCESFDSCQGNFVFDGEVVALDESGKPSFQRLQQSGGRLAAFAGRSSGKQAKQATLLYYVFDILYAGGRNLTNVPIARRKEILRSVLPEEHMLKMVESLGDDGEAAFEACVENGLEGVVAKKEDSLYEEGRRSRSWLKIKASLSDEFLICGFTEGTGARRRTFGSLILGNYDDRGKLQYIGGVGTGFDTEKLTALLKSMKPLIVRKCPFDKKPPAKLHPTWVTPVLVAEVKFMERTRDNSLRAPVFMRLRDDIKPAAVKKASVLHVESRKRGEVTLQKAAADDDKAGRPPATDRRNNNKKQKDNPAEVESVLEQLDNEKDKVSLEFDSFELPLTHLNKIYWPAYDKHPPVTKRDYLCYLARVSPYLMPHMKDRMITLVRFPNGINAARFYQKHWGQDLPKFVETARLFTEHEEKDQQFLICNNLPTLLWLGQIADLELHTAHTRVTAQPDANGLSEKMTGSLRNLDKSIANYPDYIVLDLDPYLYSGKEKQGEEPELHRQGFKKCCQIAGYLKEHLDNLKLSSFVKTSGKTGLHIYIPIKRNVDYDTVREISAILCRQVEEDHGHEATMEWAVKKRKGKVFLDHNMNARAKSLASIYSPRVAPRACVSTPIDWDELSSIYPTDFDMRTVPERLARKGDLWRDILEERNDLTRAFKAEIKS